MENPSLPFPTRAMGWEERERVFTHLQQLFPLHGATHFIFSYTETRIFEEEYKFKNTKRQYLYVCKGNFKALLDDLQVYHFDNNRLFLRDSVLTLSMTQTRFRDCFVRQPKKRTVIGTFYAVDAFTPIPFSSPPITKNREGFPVDKLNSDSIPLIPELKTYIKKHLPPLQATKDIHLKMRYVSIVKKGLEDFVPKRVNERAFQTAVSHNLTNLEFNFLNFFYETKKAMRNGNGQLFYDYHQNGIGWNSDRKWVKREMEHLIDLKLVSFEVRHDCRDKRATSWYFYDASQPLDELEHDF